MPVRKGTKPAAKAPEPEVPVKEPEVPVPAEAPVKKKTRRSKTGVEKGYFILSPKSGSVVTVEAEDQLRDAIESVPQAEWDDLVIVKGKRLKVKVSFGF